jgi:hypothetical protein
MTQSCKNLSITVKNSINFSKNAVKLEKLVEKCENYWNFLKNSTKARKGAYNRYPVKKHAVNWENAKM